MKLKPEYFEAIVYLFEKRNGSILDDFQLDLINKFGEIKSQTDNEIIDNIIANLESNLYNKELRNSAYWSLSKLNKDELIPQFQKWLRQEFEKRNATEVYQLSIALNNLGERVFSKSSTAV
ncbi:MAG: hypothetical protein IR153_10095 [Flavobacterium sp.]|nr:hypothetical protein [Flavobacterium sp.]